MATAPAPDALGDGLFGPLCSRAASGFGLFLPGARLVRETIARLRTDASNSQTDGRDAGMRSPWPSADSRFSLSTLLLRLFSLPAVDGSGRGSQPVMPARPGRSESPTTAQLWLLAVDGSSEHQIQLRLRLGRARRPFLRTGAGWSSTRPTASGPVPLPAGRRDWCRGLPPALTRPSFDAAWAPDGRSIVFAGEEGIYRADPAWERPGEAPVPRPERERAEVVGRRVADRLRARPLGRSRRTDRSG